MRSRDGSPWKPTVRHDLKIGDEVRKRRSERLRWQSFKYGSGEGLRRHSVLVSEAQLNSEPTLPEENVQFYPRPAIAEPTGCRIRVILTDRLIVETTRAIRVLETHHAPTYYVPPEDVHANLGPVTGQTFCEWKGVASYFDVVAGAHIAHRAAWRYDSPRTAFTSLKGYLAFYASKMQECSVAGVRVRPQDGDFYGGWVTPNLTGTIKGSPGTRHW